MNTLVKHQAPKDNVLYLFFLSWYPFHWFLRALYILKTLTKFLSSILHIYIYPLFSFVFCILTCRKISTLLLMSIIFYKYIFKYHIKLCIDLQTLLFHIHSSWNNFIQPIYRHIWHLCVCPHKITGHPAVFLGSL